MERNSSSHGMSRANPIGSPRMCRRLQNSGSNEDQKSSHHFTTEYDGEEEVIGFARLPEQVHRRAVKKGFEFCLMVVGESGLGKSTLLDTLFLTDMYKDRDMLAVQERLSKTVDIDVKQLDMTERGVKLRLSIIDTPGFGDPVNGETCWKPIIDYVDEQFGQYFRAESGLNRKHIQDTRVHCCLYFISPYGHGLKQMDVDMMKRLHNKVNIIPLIAKSDILTPKELKRLKANVLQEIAQHNIQIYQFPNFDSDDEDEFSDDEEELRAAIPFAVVGSNSIVEAGGKTIRSRTYPWGIVEVDNPNHCDFLKLKKTISTHMQDLKDVTADTLYENYRAEHLKNDDNGLRMAASKSSEMETMLNKKDQEIQKMKSLLNSMQSQMSLKGSSSRGTMLSHPEDTINV
ncbi:hypothetical protein ScPMuIL_005806 [Solemya velum]